MKIIKICSSCRQQYSDYKEHNITTCSECSSHSRRSKLESDLFDIVKIMRPSAQNSVKHLLSNEKEIDMYLPDLNIAIEFNGLLWHSEILSLQNGKDKKRDFKKFIECKDNMIKHIMIYEDEFLHKKEQLLNFLEYHLEVNDIYSNRKIYTKPVRPRVGIKFVEKYSMYPNINNAFYYGIYNLDTDEIIGIITYKIIKIEGLKYIKILDYTHKTNYNLKYCWRQCFESILQFTEIDNTIMYCNNRLNQEDFAQLIGLKYNRLIEPSYEYFKYPESIRMVPGTVESKIKDESLTEWEKMLIEGYNRIWNCGQSVYAM